MRVGNGDAGEAAEPLHDLGGRGIDERDAVPKDVARGSAHKQGALADGEFGNRPDPDQAGLVLLVGIEMPARERLEGGPPLATRGDELALVLADRAARRRLDRRRELAAAGLADEGGHAPQTVGWVEFFTRPNNRVLDVEALGLAKSSTQPTAGPQKAVTP